MNNNEVIIICSILIIGLLFSKKFKEFIIYSPLAVVGCLFFSKVFKISLIESVPIAIAGVFCVNDILKSLRSVIKTSLSEESLYRYGAKGKRSILIFDTSFMVVILHAYLGLVIWYLYLANIKSIIVFIAIMYIFKQTYKSIKEVLDDYVRLTSVEVIMKKEKELEELKRLVYTDPLTGVMNRTCYENEIKRLDELDRLHTGIGIFVFDINDLKKVNDKFGHVKGDEYIKNCVDTMKKVLDSNMLYRIGGDEFVYLVENTTKEALNSISRSIDNEFQIVNIEREMPLSIAYGYYLSEEVDISFLDIFKKADLNMYENKAGMKAQRNSSNISDFNVCENKK